MSLDATPAGRPSFLNRAVNLLMRPKAEWAVIDAEPASIKGIYLSYLLIWLAVPAMCQLIGQLVFGVNVFGFIVRPPLFGTLVGVILNYAAMAAWIFVFALIIDLFAPSFGGQKNAVQAFKAAAYAGAPSYVAGVLYLVISLPFLGMLAWLGLFAAAVYGVYLLYLGLRNVMKSPADKAVLYTLVVCLVGGIIGFVLFFCVGLINTMAGAGAAGALAAQSAAQSAAMAKP